MCSRFAEAAGVMLVLALLAGVASHGRAANRTWTAGVSGDFGAAANWTGGVPGAADTATFSAAGTYTVTFDNSPNPLANPVLNQDMFFQSGGVTFNSGSGGPYTYRLTGAGGDDAVITGGSLSLGTSGNPLHLTVDDDLVVRGGSVLNVNFGSHLNTADLFVGQSGGLGNGTVIVDGTGSQLNATASAINIALNGNTAALSYRNSAQGTLATAGTVSLAQSGNAATVAVLDVESDADLNVGSLNIGTGSAAATGTVNVRGTGSTLDLLGAATLTVGHATAGIGSLNIGTTSSGGTFTTGTGAATINANGTVAIGSGANTGTLNANGNFIVDGGVLTRDNGSIFSLASGKTMTIENGGRATFIGTAGLSGANYSTASGASYNVTGTGSVLETTSTTRSFFMTGNATVAISSGGLLSTAGSLDITTGTLTIDGSGSSVVSNPTFFNRWGSSSGTTAVTFSHDATGTFNGTISLADTGADGVTSAVNVLSGADLSTASLRVGANTFGAANATATVNLQGSGSSITAGLLTVGNGNAGSAVIDIGTTESGAALTITDTGTVNIEDTGAIHIGSGANTGTLNLNGNITIDGGTFTRASGSNFNLTAGRTMTVENGGRATFNGDFFPPANATYNVRDTGSVLENIGASTVFGIYLGATVNVTAGGLVSADNAFFIADNGNGTLIVDGNGSSVVANGQAIVLGANGNLATLTLRNDAAATFVGGMNLANFAAAGTRAVVNVESGAILTAGSVLLASVGGATTSATINVTGEGSLVTQTDASALTIGHSSTGTATLNIHGGSAPEAEFSTGTGLTKINRTGAVNIGTATEGGNFRANGNVTIDGGMIQTLNPNADFILAAGKNLTIQNGGRASLEFSYVTSDNAIYNITGPGSTFEIRSGTFNVNDGAVVNVAAGGRLSASNIFQIGLSTDGTLVVDGSGSSAASNSGNASSWKGRGNTAAVTFRNNAAGSFTGGVNLTAIVDVLSGAELNAGNLNLAAFGGVSNSATLNIQGSGSTVALTPSAMLTVGHASSGTATINVGDGATLSVGTGGSTTLNATGTINIDDGSVDLQSLNDNGGTINLNAGSLSFIGNVTIGAGGILGENVTLTVNRQLALSGTTTIDPSHELILDGGTLITGSLVAHGNFVFNRGTLGFIQAGASINSPVGGSTSAATITISANNVSLGSVASFSGFSHQGTLNVGANSVTLNSAGYARLGVLTSLAGGSITAANGVTFGSGSNFLGNGTVSARVTGELGSVIEANGALALGDAASPAGFNFAGELRTKDFAVTLNSSAQAALGNLTTLGNGASLGTLNATNGFVVDFGESVTGVGTINSINALAKRAIVNGTVRGNSPTEPITLTGYVKGVGTFDNVVFAGTFAPGLSPAILTVGNVAFTTTNRLIIELGGMMPGSQHDQLIYSGTASFAGTLDIDLLSGIAPANGDEFVLATYGSHTGEFNTLDFPSLAAGLTWSLDYGPTNLTLSVTSTLLPGDIDLDGDVDRTDAALFTPHLGTTTGAIWTTGDFDGDGMTTLHDLALQQSNFGATLPSPAAANAVPEPASAVLVASAAAIVFVRRMRRAHISAPAPR